MSCSIFLKIRGCTVGRRRVGLIQREEFKSGGEGLWRFYLWSAIFSPQKWFYSDYLIDCPILIPVSLREAKFVSAIFKHCLPTSPFLSNIHMSTPCPHASESGLTQIRQPGNELLSWNFYITDIRILIWNLMTSWQTDRLRGGNIDGNWDLNIRWVCDNELH